MATASATLAPIPLAGEPGIKAREGEALARALADRFVDLLGDLTPEEWDAVTACDPWTVKDIATHLLGWADALCSPREMAAQARGAMKRRKRFGSIVDAQNDVQVEAGRALSTDEVLDRLRVMLPRAARLRRRVGGALHYVPAYQSYLGGAINVGYLMNVIFVRDLLVHTVDVAAATGREAPLGTAAARVLADMAKDWGRRTGADATLHLTGPAGGSFLAGAGNRATISGPAASFVQELARRRPSAPLTVEGDETAAREWLASGCPV